MMRMKQRITAICALTLATGAVAGGALVTSRAMASDTTPDLGTVVVMSEGAGGGDAFQCTFSSSELPTVRDVPAPPNSGDFVTESHSADTGWLEASGSTTNGEEPVGGAQSAEVALADSGSAHGAFLASEPVRAGTLDECAAVREDFAHS